MSEHRRVEAERGDLPLAASSLFHILKAHWIAEPEDVHADIARDQQSLTLPEKRDLTRAVTGRVNHMQPADDRQRFAIRDVPINPHRLHPLLRTPDEAVCGPRQETWGRGHGAERATSLGERSVHRVHVGGGAGFPNYRGRAADVVGMTVREDQVPEVAWSTSKLPDCIEHDRCLARKTRVHEREFGSPIEQHGIGHSKGYEIGTLDDLF